MSIRVLIADDHEVVRTGMISLLRDSDVDVVAEAGGGDQAIEMTESVNPDVVLMDIRMPDRDGLSALEEILTKNPEARVIMVSTFDNPTYMARAMAIGAKDYVSKSSSREELLSSIQAVAAGQTPPQSEGVRRVLEAMLQRAPAVQDDIVLTKREAQVLRHVALGLSNKEIGKSLDISVETVKEHVQNILRKIRATDRTQAAVWAVRKGIVR